MTQNEADTQKFDGYFSRAAWLKLHRNAVVALTTSALVLGTSFPVIALDRAAYADTSMESGQIALAAEADNEETFDEEVDGSEYDASDDEAYEEEEDSSDAEDVTDESDAADNSNAANNSATDSSAANTATANTSTATNATNTSNATVSTNTNTNTASQTDATATTTTDYTDPEAATANEEFGEPTTEVVIEGSVNGEIMALIALAEPDGIPEGEDYNKYNYGSGEPWCAYFVMYCARAAGLSTEVIPNYPGCPMLVSYYQGLERWQDFTPKYQAHVGDLIFFSETPGGVAAHVGIVTASTSTTVSTREGNSGVGAVESHVYSTTNEDGLVGNDWYILGYASPEYPETVEHEHKNEVASILNVSETSHLVTYEDCVCGYEKGPELVSHNFQSATTALTLSESDEWVCIDCGATAHHYAKGILESSEAIDLYDPVTKERVKQLPQGSSLAVTDVWIGADGDYWGTTAGGYDVRMAEAGVKQTDLFTEVTEGEATTNVATGASSSQTTATTQPQAGAVVVERADYEADILTEVYGTALDGEENTTAVEVADLQKGGLYVVEIDSVSSLKHTATERFGSPMCKLVDKDENGKLDTSALKVYGTSSFKLNYSDEPQRVVIAPDRDATLVLGGQFGIGANSNSVRFEGVTVTRLS